MELTHLVQLDNRHVIKVFKTRMKRDLYRKYEQQPIIAEKNTSNEVLCELFNKFYTEKSIYRVYNKMAVSKVELVIDRYFNIALI